LQFSFLAGGGCAKSQILTFFKHCFWTFYDYGTLDTVQITYIIITCPVWCAITALVAVVAVQSQISLAHFCNINI
jgi:hypothetical protein